MAQPTDGTGFWTRTDVLQAIDYVQREITRLTENLMATTSTIEPITAATSITIDANGNFIRGFSAYRTYGGNTRQVFFYTEEQIASFDGAWKSRTGAQIRALITDIADEGKALIYPIPDNSNNDIVVNYIKLASKLTTEGTIEIPDPDVPCLEYGVKAHLYSFEKDGKDQNKAAFWKQLYGSKDPVTGILTGELAEVKRRARKRRGSDFAVLQDRQELDGIRTRPYFPWES
jgi:hypothetical protein